jgi:hypothetical protein
MGGYLISALDSTEEIETGFLVMFSWQGSSEAIEMDFTGTRDT